MNGSFLGPVIRIHKGDTVYVNVQNQGNYGVTIHSPLISCSLFCYSMECLEIFYFIFFHLRNIKPKIYVNAAGMELSNLEILSQMVQNLSHNVLSAPDQTSLTKLYF